MKNKTLYILAISAIVMIALGSCKKELAKTNIDPDHIDGAQVDPNFLLTTVQLSYTGSSTPGGSAWSTKWGGVGCFVQHVASTGGFYYGDKYQNNTGGMGALFQDSYTQAVQPAVELYQLTVSKPQYRNLHQMARIMKAMIFEQLTDLYGDIPYSQAGLGYYSHIYTPVYDKQQDIYNDLLKEVSQATDSLDDAADHPTGDVIYSQSGNQIAEWKMFGNSLLLRMAMRLTKVDPTTAQKYVKQVIGKTMASNDDNGIIQHIQSSNALTANQDAAQIFSQDSTDIRLSSTLVSNMKKNADPRLPVVAWIAYGVTGDDPDNLVFPSVTDSTAAAQIGLPPGYIIGGLSPATNLLIVAKDSLPDQVLGGYSRISNNLLSLSAPSLVLTYAETELLLADASLRWGIGGDAQTHFKNGVEAAINQYSAYGDFPTISDDDADNYYQSFVNNYGSVNLSQVNMQYWLASLMDEYESWSNWRRSGDLPYLKPTNYPGNVTGGTIPRRLNYPVSQKNTNLANYNKAVANLTGGDRITSRVWWDVAK